MSSDEKSVAHEGESVQQEESLIIGVDDSCESNHGYQSGDDLCTLRGEGRYFGVLELSGEAIGRGDIRCNNCNERGHIKRECPHTICSYCGVMDEHESQHCPKSIKCTICNESGHYRSQCPQKWKKINCSICNAKTHTVDNCPTVWRSYVLKTDEIHEKQQVDMPSVYCYNCGYAGHFGDDCNERRSSRVPNHDGSAFSGENLSRMFKKKYYNSLEHDDGNQYKEDYHGDYQEDCQDDYRNQQYSKRSYNDSSYYENEHNEYPSDYNNNWNGQLYPQQYQQQAPTMEYNQVNNNIPQPTNTYTPVYGSQGQSNTYYNQYDDVYNQNYGNTRNGGYNNDNYYKNKRNANNVYNNSNAYKGAKSNYQPSRSGTLDDGSRDIEY